MIVNAPSSTSAVRTHSGATWRRRVARGAARDQPAEAPSLALRSGSGSSERAHPPGRDISRHAGGFPDNRQRLGRAWSAQLSRQRRGSFPAGGCQLCQPRVNASVSSRRGGATPVDSQREGSGPTNQRAPFPFHGTSLGPSAKPGEGAESRKATAARVQIAFASSVGGGFHYCLQGNARIKGNGK